MRGPQVVFDLTEFMRQDWLQSRHEGGETSVYAFHCDPSFIKVGVAWNVDQRIRELQMMNPHPSRLLRAWCFQNRIGAILAERAAHRFLRPFHHHGEWFSVDAETVAMLLESIHQHIPALVDQHWRKFIHDDIQETNA